MLGSITVHTSDFFKHCLFCNKTFVVATKSSKKQYHAAILVSCTPQCIHTEQTTKAKCASTYLQLHHMFRQCLRNGGMVLGANRNNWQNIGAIPYPAPRIRMPAKGWFAVLSIHQSEKKRQMIMTKHKIYAFTFFVSLKFSFVIFLVLNARTSKTVSIIPL